MATPAYIPLATVTLAASADFITFTSISQDYVDLVLVAETKISASGGDIGLIVNDDDGYTQVIMRGNGSAAASFTVSSSYLRMSANDPASGERHLLRADFFDYSSTTKHKTILSRSDNAADSTGAIASRYASTSAITSIKLFMQTGTSFDAGSTATLYGILGTE